jgi:zinc/manganese transport system substrate-binding protein
MNARTMFAATLIAMTISSTISSTASAAPLKVASSFSILEDFVQNVGGSRVSVVNIVPADADTHTYQPTTDDARKLSGAKLVFVSGVGFEAWLDKLVKNTADRAKVVTVSKGLTPRKFEEDGQLEDDPHMWWNIVNAQKYVTNIRDALVKTDPAGKATYTANATTYLAALSVLDAYTKTQVALIPSANRKLVTDHDALGYFADRYGFTVIGTIIPSGTTSSEPSAKDLAALTNAIKAAGVKAIFPENILNPKLAESVAKETGAKVAPALYTDALGPKGSSGDTFLKAFRFNVDTIVAAMK